ncbi:lipase 1-like [Planococcus citri]|uniref:lipase 1-like n=1 Tax=Planococcus citri TaxID=170843 RepID=UPI0031F7E67A
MSILDFLLYVILSIYVYSPINLTNDFINGLQTTSNPDTYLTPPQIITRHGYPVETFYVRTPDGFILQLHRIPNRDGNLLPILLVHGYLDSSFTWIADGPETALAYLLANQGYDVWMINTRGNTFSRSHANYTPMERAFWDFSFHEMGIYDIPTTIDFVLNKTNHNQLMCICDSAGNSEFYITLSVLPQYNDKVIAQVSLAPFYHESPSILTIILQPIIDYILEYLYQNTQGAFLEHDLLTKLVVKVLTSVRFFGYSLYEFALLIAYGWLPNHVNREIMPTIYNNFPAGTSVKTTQQLFQFENSFSYFDYGLKENQQIYGTPSPPKYNISNINIPTRIYHALLDIASSLKDVRSLYSKLPKKAGLIEISDLGFTHMDFIWNKNAKKLMYDDVIQFVNDVLNNNASSTIT